MRYVSSEEARSDLFLSAAVYLVGPLIVEILLGFIPLRRIVGVTAGLEVVLPLVYTVLVPYLLIRYRRESVRDYFSKGGGQAFAFGLLLALPVVATAVPGMLVEGGSVQEAVPVLLATQPATIVGFAEGLTFWAGLAALAVYATVKARDAFRSDPQLIRNAGMEIARVLGVIAVVVTILLLLARRAQLSSVLLPLGVAGAVALALSRVRGLSSTSRAILLTPVLLLALQYILTFDPGNFVERLYFATLLGGIGLVFGVLQESTYSAYGALAMALVIALATPLGLLSPFGVLNV
jgi:hypothetical protein